MKYFGITFNVYNHRLRCGFRVTTIPFVFLPRLICFLNASSDIILHMVFSACFLKLSVIFQLERRRPDLLYLIVMQTVLLPSY